MIIHTVCDFRNAKRRVLIWNSLIFIRACANSILNNERCSAVTTCICIWVLKTIRNFRNTVTWILTWLPFIIIQTWTLSIRINFKWTLATLTLVIRNIGKAIFNCWKTASLQTFRLFWRACSWFKRINSVYIITIASNIVININLCPIKLIY